MGKVINWGIIGTGNIARRFIKGLSYSTKGKLYAVASLTSADKLKEEFKDVVVYDDYHKLLNDPNIDAVYIANRHKDHYFWSLEALKRKKAVLCEKPAALTYKENEEVIKCAKEHQTFYMEAMKTPFIPLIQDIKEVVTSGKLGKVERIETCFAYDFPTYSPKHYLFDEEQGGILNDTGSYCMFFILDYIDAPIKGINAEVEFKYGVDANDKIEIIYENNQTASIDIALNEDKRKIGVIYGELGKIVMEPFYRPQSATVYLNDGTTYELKKEYIDDFIGEIEEVHECILNNQLESKIMSYKVILNLRQLTDQIRKEIYKQ